MTDTHPSFSPAAPYQPIENYAVIGDLHTVALVGINGSIDWYCLPRFDAPSLFGALLDTKKGGFFRLAPTELAVYKTHQIYLPETNILLTRFLSVDGVGELTDFMPLKPTGTAEYQHHLIRSVSVTHGSLSFTLTCRPAFNYARNVHQFTLFEQGARFQDQQVHLGLASPIPLQRDEQNGVQARFTLHAGQCAHFLLESTRDSSWTPHLLTDEVYQQAFRETARYWRGWIAQCQYQGRWREMVHRSALVLKLLTYAPTGAIVAAATTSLPESPGGARNWDYRYTWIRDASFSLYSLLTLGFTQEAEAFMGWLDARCNHLKDGRTLQPMYGIAGEQHLTEITLDHLEGYRQSHPVRVGNGAYTQIQLDIYGELLDAIYIYNRYEAISYDLWQNLTQLLGWLQNHWQEPDAGIWEVRGGVQHFLHSRLMSWVAFDRAIRVARHRGWPAPVDDWRKSTQQIKSSTPSWNCR